jgi:hypothetical protein
MGCLCSRANLTHKRHKSVYAGIAPHAPVFNFVVQYSASAAAKFEFMRHELGGVCGKRQAGLKGAEKSK